MILRGWGHWLMGARRDGPYIHVGYAKCPNCETLCTAHRLITGDVRTAEWESMSLDYVCGKCKMSFKKQGDPNAGSTRNSEILTNDATALSGCSLPETPYLAQYRTHASRPTGNRHFILG